jgi:hypothetical protein
MSRIALARFALGTLLGGFLAPPPVMAQALPSATSDVLCGTSAGNIADPFACSSIYDRAQVLLDPAPSLWASGDYPGGLARVQAGANARLTYSFEVVGGQVGDPVHLDITTLLHWQTQGSPNAYAFSRVIVTTNLGEVTANICSFLCGSGTGVTDFYGDLHVDARSGGINTVAMDVYASAAFSQDANSASAFADPRISIDPLTLNAGNYALVFSGGVGNSVGQLPAVPEPSSWALLLLGLGGIQLGARRRGRATTPANRGKPTSHKAGIPGSGTALRFTV